jgi:alpha(1,3/1,4) fucosyltransferase
MKNILFNCFNNSDLNDQIFKLNRVWLSSNDTNVQKDDKNLGFLYFEKKLRNNNYNIHTQDFWNKNDKIDLQINFAYHQKITCNKSYLLLPESKEIYSKNDLNKLKEKYTKIFCQYDDYVDNIKIFKINYPFIIKEKFVNNFNERPLLSCMISSNKSQKKNSQNDLYHKRFEIINFAERKYLEHFRLYGMDWDLPFKKSGIYGRLINYKDKLFKRKNFLKTYKGVIENKKDILTKTKFVFCVENLNINGYISDPIFDAFNNGCIPIYLGAKNINSYIPNDTFINFNNFENIESIFEYIISLNDEEYNQMQINIKNFIESSKIDFFNEEGFASKILKHLNMDIK